MKNKGLKKNIRQNIADKRGSKNISRNKSFRKRRILNGPPKNSESNNNSKSEEKFYSPVRKTLLRAPDPDFTLMENTDEVVQYMDELKDLIYYRNNIKLVIIDLRRIVKIDIGAICMLLSVVDELNLNKVPVEGNFPKDEKCASIFMESGFLNHMRKITGAGFSIPKNRNLIIKQGRDKTKNEEVGKAVKEAVRKITGEEAHYHPVYSIIQEINGNAVEHAYDDKKHWLFGFNYDEEKNRVIFTFADNGFGILKTLKKKNSQKVFDNLNLRNDAQILQRAFEKKYNSRHMEQENRNKGLPLLNKIQSQKEVKNLMVVTNKVSLQLEKGSTKLLKSNFSGTFYYWELDMECIENGRKNNKI